MASLKQLAGQTAIYGLSTILGRLLNFALTPLHTRVLAQEEYGVVTDVYTMIAFMMVVLTFGMETGFFRYFNDNKEDKKAVFSASTGLVIGISSLVIILALLFLEPLAEMLRYEQSPHFVLWMLLIVAGDAIAAVPYAKLRAENRPYRFIFVRLTTIGVIVLLNLAFFLLFPWMEQNGLGQGWLDYIYVPGAGVAYIFIANLIGNGLMILLFLPELLEIRPRRISRKLLLRLTGYAAPLVLAGLAGIANEMANRQFLKYLLPVGENFRAMGLFGANVKIATFMVLFIQAFRFAAEPFFFSGQGDFKDKMGRVMRYFVLVQSLIFLGLVCFLDLIKWTHFVDPKFWEGLHIVPVLLFANLLLGINFNLNIWYKLKNKTRLGAYITFIGLIFTVLSNLVLVPRFSYAGAAWATLISYAAMTIYSFYLNQKHDPIHYRLGRLGFYVFTSLALAAVAFYGFDSHWLAGIFCFGLYVLLIAWKDGSDLKNVVKNVRNPQS